MEPLLITSYPSPDLDGSSCVVAYAELLTQKGVSVAARIIDEPIAEVIFMFNYLGMKMPETVADACGFEKIILLDASEVHMLEGKIPPEKVVEIIDHRKVNDAAKFPNAKIQIESVGAAATLVLERFIADSARPSKSAAALLQGAIISNTLNFRGGVTTDRDRAAMEYLSPISELKKDFWKELFAAKSDFAGEKLEKAIKGDFAKWRFKKGSVGMGQLEMIGAKELLRSRQGEALNALWKIEKELSLDCVLLNFVDIEEDCSYFLAGNDRTREVFEKTMGVKFKGAVAPRPGMLLRKQILPFLKAELDA